MEVVGATLGVLILFILWRIWHKKPSYPPGPKGLPFIGNLHQLDSSGIHKTFIKWSKIFGDIFKIQILSNHVIVVNNEELIYEVLVKRSNDFADRVISARMKIFNKDTLDVGFQSISPEWIRRKKLAMKTLKGFGEGLVQMEEISHVYIEKMIENIIEKTKGTASVNMKPLLHNCTAGIITSIIYGKDLKVSLSIQRFKQNLTLIIVTKPINVLYS